MTRHAIDCVTFKLKPEAERAAFLKESSVLSEWLKTRPGFVSRRMGFDASGTWVDTTEWGSMDNLKATAEVFLSAPETAGLMSLIDPASVGGYHIEITDSLN